MSGATFSRDLKRIFSPGTLWPEIQRETAKFARSERDRLIAAGQFSRAYETFVNGVEDAAEETIRPNGMILYRARSLGPAIALALAFLRQRSPEQRAPQGARHNTATRYRDSFMVGVSRGDAQGGAIPMASFDPDRVTADATEAFIYSPLPFSRIVDVQMEGGRRIRFSVEPGLFADAAGAVRRAFPLLDASRIYNVEFPDKYRPKFSKRAVQSPGLVIRLP